MSYRPWGAFHLFTIIISILFPFILWLILKNKKESTKRIVLFIFAIFGVAILIYNFFDRKNYIYDLPLHMCSINGFLLPYVCLSKKNKTLGNLLMIWCVGALGALIFNFEVENMTTSDSRSWTYFLSHMIEFGLPIAIGLLKVVKLDYKNMVSTLILTFSIYTIVHFINVGIEKYFLVHLNQVVYPNYFFSMNHCNSPFLVFFWNILPYRYFYLLLILPLIFILFAIIYGHQIINVIKEKRNRKKKMVK